MHTASQRALLTSRHARHAKAACTWCLAQTARATGEACAPRRPHGILLLRQPASSPRVAPCLPATLLPSAPNPYPHPRPCAAVPCTRPMMRAAAACSAMSTTRIGQKLRTYLMLPRFSRQTTCGRGRGWDAAGGRGREAACGPWLLRVACRMWLRSSLRLGSKTSSPHLNYLPTQGVPERPCASQVHALCHCPFQVSCIMIIIKGEALCIDKSDGPNEVWVGHPSMRWHSSCGRR